MPSEHDAFLRTIRENPDDDTPRLVYADYLQDHGDDARTARAEFIRLQIQLAGSEDDLRLSEQRRFRAARLLARYGRKWVTAIDGGIDGRPAPQELLKHEFRRGFVESISVEGRHFDAVAAAVFPFHPVREVRLEGMDDPDAIGLLDDSESLGGVESLHIGRGDFDQPGISDHGLERLLHNPHLKNLHSLDVDGQKLTNRVAELLRPCPRLPRLRSLRLAQHSANAITGPQLEAEALPAFLSVPAFAALSSLELDSVAMAGKGVEVIRRVAGRLTRLGLRRCNLGDGGVIRLVELAADWPIRGLDLRQNRIGVEGCAALASGQPPRRLRELLLSSNTIGDEGVRELARRDWSLGSLSLRKCGCGNAAGEAIAGGGPFPGLCSLDVSQCRLTIAGVRALLNRVRLPSLRSLDLRHNRLRGKARHRARKLGAGNVRLRF